MSRVNLDRALAIAQESDSMSGTTIEALVAEVKELRERALEVPVGEVVGHYLHFTTPTGKTWAIGLYEDSERLRRVAGYNLAASIHNKKTETNV